MSNKVTAKMISEACGVNPSTVSRVLNNSSLISQETKEYVLKMALKMGYKVNDPFLIQKSIAVLHPYMDIYLLSDIENKLEKIFANNGYRVFYTGYKITQDFTPEMQNGLLQQVVSMGVDAIIIVSDGQYEFDISDIKIPVIFLDLEATITNSDHYHVGFDFVTGGKLAANLLIRSGCKKPIILNTRHFVDSPTGRNHSFIQAFVDHGITIGDDQIISTEGVKSSVEESKNIVHYLLAKGLDFDSIYALSDWRAFGALLALNEMDIKVPEQIKIVGFDGSKLAKNNFIPITSIECDPRIAAIQISEFILQIINKETVKEKNIIIPVSIFQGKTV